MIHQTEGTFIQRCQIGKHCSMWGILLLPRYRYGWIKDQTYKDIYEITRQVFYFTRLSHRSFIPANIPVTIKYPNLMARMVSELKKDSQLGLFNSG